MTTISLERAPGREQALRAFVREQVAVQVRVEAPRGQWSARARALLRVNAVYAEPGAQADAIRELARWLDARELAYGTVPKAWQAALR